MTFSIYKKTVAVIFGLFMFVFSQLAFAENCNVPLNNLGSNLDCPKRWDLYNYLHNAQPFLNFERAALSMNMDNTDSVLAAKQAAVDLFFSSVDAALILTDDDMTAEKAVKEIGFSAVKNYLDSIDSEHLLIAVDSFECMYGAVDDFKIAGLASATGGAALCVTPQIISSWHNLKATFAFYNIAEQFNSITTASTYLLDCYRNGGACSKTPSETANSLGFTNSWWRTQYDAAYLNELISKVRNSVARNTSLRMNSNNNYTTPVVLSESQLPKVIPLPATPPTGTPPQPIVGKRTDLTPDFDVYNGSGSEVSANCNGCSGKPLTPTQSIRATLTTQIINADADSYKRSSKSDSIEGYIWWKIEGKTDWSLLTGSLEYDVKNLDKNAEREESFDWNVPNYVGDILAMKACVDGDDEIQEESEGDRVKISNPDQGGTTNNCSRTERFYIVPPEVAAQPEPPIEPQPDPNQAEVAQKIIPIITDLLLTDPQLTVVVQGNGRVISSSPKAVIGCPSDCSESMSSPAITLVAKPKKGNVFTGWVGGCEKTAKRPTCKLSVTDDKTITATFAKQ